MKNRFIKFIRVYWKGMLLYALGGALVSFLIIFIYFGGTSFFGMEGYFRKSMMATHGHLFGDIPCPRRCPGHPFFLVPNVFYDGRRHEQNAQQGQR